MGSWPYTLVTPYTNTTKVTTEYPLKYLKDWSPFKIDALGLVTLLGAEEINASVGRLVRSRYFEYLPFLGGFVISSNAFTEKQGGFLLHNVTSGIMTPDLTGWLTRWLKAQNFHPVCSKVHWKIEPKPHSFAGDTITAAAIGLFINAGFITMTVCMSDWWGFANAMSMAISILVRWYVIKKNRDWLDEAVDRAERADKKKKEVSMIVTLSDSKAIIMKVRECLMVPCFINTPQPFIETAPPKAMTRTNTPSLNGSAIPLGAVSSVPSANGSAYPGVAPGSVANSSAVPPTAYPMPTPVTATTTTTPDIRSKHAYRYVRWIGWAAFGGHVISIGMSDLVTQLVTVAIIVFPTLAIIRGWGCGEDLRVGSRLVAEKGSWIEEADEQRRVDLYAYLNLNSEEEQSLKKWDLTPDERPATEEWWKQYRAKRDFYRQPFPDRAAQLAQRKLDFEVKYGKIKDPSQTYPWQRFWTHLTGGTEKPSSTIGGP